MTQNSLLTDSAMSQAAGERRSVSEGDTKANPIALRALKQFEQEQITYCVLRGGDQLDEDEVDLLVEPRHMRRLRRVLSELGFVRLRAWGHAPHHFFITYDAHQDRWLKLDVVTRIAYGRPTHSLETPLAKNCLDDRRKAGSVFVPRAEDELVALLLHCVVDKRSFPEHWRLRISQLCEQLCDEDYVSDLLGKYWLLLSARTLQRLVEEGHWDWFLEDRPAVMKRLAGRHPMGAAVRSARDHALRKLHRLAKLLWPQSLSVALLAPDGAGKSTLAEGISSHFFLPVEQVYMGLYQQGSKERETRLPGLGLASKLCSQWRRYLRAHLHRTRGRLVIFDRYTYDALLPAPYRLSRRQRLRRWLLAYSCPAPDLILLLDAPAEVLFARKGEHHVEYLDRHRQAYVKMLRKFPQMTVVDATRKPDEVRRKAISHIWHGFVERFGERHEPQNSQSLTLTKKVHQHESD